MLASLSAEHERRLTAERRGAWRDVARRVAHEVRNPLSPIRLAVDNLRRARVRDASVLEQALDVELSAIETEVARLDRLVSEFSEFARMPQPLRTPMTLGEVVETAIRGQVTEPARIEVRIEPGGGLDETILGDRDLLGQAIANLARNAVEAFGGETGTIRARARREEGSSGASSVVLEIEDDGPGIDESIGDTLFEPDVSGRGGAGLGLTITRRVIAEHFGTIAVVSPPDGGTRFVITLPADGRHSREGRCRAS
jgi:nitrogen fixation/metabolism regulation signal transduction histidine kinase